MPPSAVSELLQLPALWHPASAGRAASRTGAGGEGSHVGEESQGSPQWQGVWGPTEEAWRGAGLMGTEAISLAEVVPGSTEHCSWVRASMHASS